MITLVSNDNISFSVYGNALTRDSKRFFLQSKYQSLDSTIKPFTGKLLSYYVDFINTGEVVLDNQYETELLSLADYMVSVRFEHEIKWQLLYRDIMKSYLKLYQDEDDGNERGLMSTIISEDDVQGNIDLTLRTLSYYMLNLKLTSNKDMMDDLSYSVKTAFLTSIFDNDRMVEFMYYNDYWMLKMFKYEHIVSKEAFEAVFGTIKSLDAFLVLNLKNPDMVKKYMIEKVEAHKSQH